MEELDLTKAKYYTDRFYIRLEGFDLDNLTRFLTDFNIGQQHAVFIHEYYHYLTNISTYAGIRQFHSNFCDRYRASTILTTKEGLNAYPIEKNSLASCKDMVKYWNQVIEILSEDDLNYALVEETERSPNKKFEITSIERIKKPMEIVTESGPISGERTLVSISISGPLNIHRFNLTFGAIDEFLSSAIDEFLFENSLSEIDPGTLSRRPFYPYLFFDALLSFYGMKRVPAVEKITIAYFALHSSNPAVMLIEVLEQLGNGGYFAFQENPEKYLLENFSRATPASELLNHIKSFSTETFKQGGINISQALRYYYDKFYVAQKLKEDDFFYFIRPFLTAEAEPSAHSQKFLLALSRIINLYTPPLILQDRHMHQFEKLTSFGESTIFILATFEILESLRTNRIATRPARQKAKYQFGDNDDECDNVDHFTEPPILGIFRVALNELGLYELYLRESSRGETAG